MTKTRLPIPILVLLSTCVSCVSESSPRKDDRPDRRGPEMIQAIYYEEPARHLLGGYSMVVVRRVDLEHARKFVLNTGLIVIDVRGKSGTQRVRITVDYADIFRINEHGMFGDTVSGIDEIMRQSVQESMKLAGEPEHWTYAVHGESGLRIVDAVEVKIATDDAGGESEWEPYEPERHNRSNRKAQQFTRVSISIDMDAKGLTSAKVSYAKSQVGLKVVKVRPVQGSEDYALVSGFRYDVHGTKDGDTAKQSSDGLSWFGVGEMTRMMNRPAETKVFKF